MFKLVFILLLFLSSWQSVSAQTETSPEPELEKVTLQLKWLHQFQFAGYYAAKLKGFYEAEGLEVEIRERDLHQNNIQQVIDGEAQYGVSDSILLLYQARKEPVVIVAPIFQHSPQVLVTLKSSGIDSPYKLDNKDIAFYNKDTDGFNLLAMFEQIGIKPKLERIKLKTDPGILVRGEVLAYPSYLSNEPYFLQKQGFDINIIRPMNFGIDFYGDMLFTNKKEAQEHPERVEKFKRATLKGWRYALKHKLELARYIKQNLNSNKELGHLLYEANAIEEVIAASSVPIGSLDQGRLQYIQNLFKKHGLIDKRLPLERGIFRPEKKNIEFSEVELAWIKQHPVVKVAVDNAWRPIEYVSEENGFTGIAAGYLNYLSNKTGIDFQPAQDLNWSEAVNKMKSQELDMYSAVINTPERRQYTRYTEPYIKFPMMIATQKGEPFIDNMKRLKSKVVAVVKDYASQENMSKHYPNIELLLVKTANEGLEAVSQGRAYAYIDNLAVISHSIQSNNLTNIQITGETPFRADIAMAIRKDWPELRSIIQKTLNGMSEETRSKLTDPWLKVSYKKEFEWQTLITILVPLTLIIIIISIYTRRLRSVNKDLIATQQQLTHSNKSLEKLSETDYLTGCYNRSYIDRIMKQETLRTKRYDGSLSLILIDLDDFKKVNDTYGHLVGDEVLISTANWIQSTIRETDAFGRWGGEEFVLICPNTGLQQAENIAEKVRMGIAQHSFSHNIQQTLSIGVTEYQVNESTDNWISRTDKALYEAKHQGKNRVSIGLTPYREKAMRLSS
ncbi:MAG: diguanylate cyclase [Pseudomonadota bacterium]|nr:diguanylate cyclase [Pseudomonadota bacterium]